MNDEFDLLMGDLRAHILDEAVPEPNFEAVEMRVAELGRRTLSEDDPELAAIADATRARVEVEILARGVPSFQSDAPPARTRWGGRVAVAAALVVALGAATASNWQAERANASGESPLSAAQREASRPDRALEAKQSTEETLPPRAKTQVPVVQVDESAEAPSPIESADEGVDPVLIQGSADSRAREAKRARLKTQSRRVRRASLLDEAEVLWRDGQLREAESRLLEVVEMGKSAEADIAWGDLFILARQLRGPASEYERWGLYLRSYPGGRHADDARAGRCRRGPQKTPRECWAAYLEDFPSGAHRAEAQLGVEDEDQR